MIALTHLGVQLRALQNHTRIRGVLGLVKRVVEQRFVGNHPARFYPARRRKDDFRLRVVDACGEFMGCETAEDH